MEAISVFQTLCKPTTGPELQRLSGRLRTHLDAFEEAALSNSDLDMGFATRLVDALDALVQEHPRLTPDQRAQVRGAVDYFLLTADADHDFELAQGLIDDARVLNHVCRELDRSDLVMQLE